MSSEDAQATGLGQGQVTSLLGRVGAMVTGSEPGGAPSGVGRRIGIVASQFNGSIVWRLLEGCLAGLRDHGVDARDVSLAWVPGAFELPLVAQAFAASGNVDAVVTLGAVIRGETGHYDFVAGECAAGIRAAQLSTGVPIIFGVLTTDTLAQALARSGEGPSNKGYEAAVGAVTMANVLRSPVFGVR